MKISLPMYFPTFMLSSFCLTMLAACAYQQPAGRWVSIDASTIYFSAVELDDKAMDPNYKSVCKEARDEIYGQLSRELPAKIAPLTLVTDKTSAEVGPAVAVLKLRIKRCELDSDQAGGTFTYYLTLPVTVSLSVNGKNLLDYSMKTYEQVTIHNPSPAFEFTFAEPVSRTLLLFNGRQLWLPDD